VSLQRRQRASKKGSDPLALAKISPRFRDFTASETKGSDRSDPFLDALSVSANAKVCKKVKAQAVSAPLIW
jgi:hypothetical protein